MRSVAGTNVPVIDISAYRDGGADRDRVVAAVDRAATEVGFMQITGHGIPDAVRDGLIEAIDAFFGLPGDQKRACVPSPGVNRGYTPPRTERLSHSLGVYSPDDLFEAFNIGTQAADFPDLALPHQHYPANLWPQGQDRLRAQITDWFEHAGRVARTMTAIFAAALGLPQDYFAPFQDHTMDVFRMNNYRMPPGDAAIEPGQLGMGAHTDYGIVTILWADAVRGLQILDTEGAWHDVVPVPGALLINLGDLLARWTNDRWISTLHRVLAPVDAHGRMYRRRSAAYFHDGNFDAVVSTLPDRVRPGGGSGASPRRASGRAESAQSGARHPARYAPITVAEHLTQKLAGSRGLELNPDAEHEAARLRSAAAR